MTTASVRSLRGQPRFHLEEARSQILEIITRVLFPPVLQRLFDLLCFMRINAAGPAVPDIERASVGEACRARRAADGNLDVIAYWARLGQLSECVGKGGHCDRLARDLQDLARLRANKHNMISLLAFQGWDLRMENFEAGADWISLAAATRNVALLLEMSRSIERLAESGSQSEKSAAPEDAAEVREETPKRAGASRSMSVTTELESGVTAPAAGWGTTSAGAVTLAIAEGTAGARSEMDVRAAIMLRPPAQPQKALA